MQIKTSKDVYFAISAKAAFFNMLRWLRFPIKHRCHACGNLHTWKNTEFIICEKCVYNKWNRYRDGK